MAQSSMFGNLLIIHPHSGEVSRARIKTALTKYFGLPSTATLSQIEKEAKHEGDLVYIEDVNNSIRVKAFDWIPSPIAGIGSAFKTL